MYPPDEGATGQLLEDLAQALAARGWRVTILAAGTNRAEHAGPVTVHRVRGLPFTRASLVRRALSYASLYPALLWRALRLPRHDVIVTLTDPPMLMVLGPGLKWLKRSRLVHWAQDIYPEVAEELGVLGKERIPARVLRWFSTWALGKHDTIVTVGRCMQQRLQQRGIAGEKLRVIPNWAVGFHNVNANPQPGRSGPFTVLYSGNFGLAHPFESIVAAIQKLDAENAPVRFVLSGHGPRLKSLREQLEHCRNVEFRAPVPLAELPASLTDADAHFACMSHSLLGLVVPSKVYGALASGRPCIFLGPSESEAARQLTETGRGVVLQAENSADALVALLKDWSTRDHRFSTIQSRCAAPDGSVINAPVDTFQSALLGS